MIGAFCGHVSQLMEVYAHHADGSTHRALEDEHLPRSLGEGQVWLSGTAQPDPSLTNAKAMVRVRRPADAMDRPSAPSALLKVDLDDRREQMEVAVRGQHARAITQRHRGDQAVHQPSWGDAVAPTESVEPRACIEVNGCVAAQQGEPRQQST